MTATSVPPAADGCRGRSRRGPPRPTRAAGSAGSAAPGTRRRGAKQHSPEQGDRDGEQGGRSGQRPVRLVVEPVGAGAEPRARSHPTPAPATVTTTTSHQGRARPGEGHRRTMPTAARIASASRATGHHAELLGRLVQEHRDSRRDRIPARWCHLGESADRPVDHVEDRAAARRERGGGLRPVARHRRARRRLRRPSLRRRVARRAVRTPRPARVWRRGSPTHHEVDPARTECDERRDDGAGGGP